MLPTFGQMLLIFVKEHKHLRNQIKQLSERGRRERGLSRAGLNTKYIKINAPDLIVPEAHG